MTSTTAPPPANDRHARRWLAACALAYGLTHHIGFGLAWLGTVGDTRWADWADVLTPYAVLLTAAAALHAGRADHRGWALYLVGAITYVEGHGIHLAANSVGNDTPGIAVVHLWDEVAGHYIWYSGTALVVAVTWTTNSLEGGTAVMGLLVAAAFTAWGLRTRHDLGGVLIPAFAPAFVALTAYGVWQRGFPQPTELGWL